MWTDTLRGLVTTLALAAGTKPSTQQMLNKHPMNGEESVQGESVRAGLTPGS